MTKSSDLKAKNLHISSPVIAYIKGVEAFRTSVIDYIFRFKTTYLLLEKPYGCTSLVPGLCSRNPSRDEEVLSRASRGKLKPTPTLRARHFKSNNLITQTSWFTPLLKLQTMMHKNPTKLKFATIIHNNLPLYVYFSCSNI